MMLLNQLAAVSVLCLAAAYLRRIWDLQFATHEFSFVFLHVLACAGCVYSAYLLYLIGFEGMQSLHPIMALLYLLRSRDTYHEVATKPPVNHDLTNRLWHR